MTSLKYFKNFAEIFGSIFATVRYMLEAILKDDAYRRRAPIEIDGIMTMVRGARGAIDLGRVTRSGETLGWLAALAMPSYEVGVRVPATGPELCVERASRRSPLKTYGSVLGGERLPCPAPKSSERINLETSRVGALPARRCSPSRPSPARSAAVREASVARRATREP